MAHKESKIRVRAKAQGVYGIMREPGAEFHIEDENHFSGKWMEHVDETGKPVKDSPVHQRYDDWQKEKAQAREATQVVTQVAPKVVRKVGKANPSGDPSQSDALGSFDPSGNKIENDPANPAPGTPDPGQKAQTEAIIDQKLGERDRESAGHKRKVI